MNDRKYYLLTLFPDTGGLMGHRMDKLPNGLFRKFGSLHVKDIPIPALAIGLKVEAAAGGRELGEPDLQEACDDEQREWEQIVIELKEKEPPESDEPVGVECFQVLTDGLLYTVDSFSDHFMKVLTGICWPDAIIWRFQGKEFSEGTLVSKTTAEMIHPWTREQGEET